MGQTFSTTKVASSLQRHEWDIGNELETADGTYEFSDGIGMISAAFAKEINNGLSAGD